VNVNLIVETALVTKTKDNMYPAPVCVSIGQELFVPTYRRDGRQVWRCCSWNTLCI